MGIRWRTHLSVNCKTNSSQRIFANPSDPKTHTLQPKTDSENFESQPVPSTSTDDDEKYPADFVHRQPQLVTPPELNDLVRYLELPKTKYQLFDLHFSSGIS
ncbi:hypothetical protein AVEN_67335-1 [Araneus ventricosus]|uniref:Uncharacterized protein n=1 Tax=Araneus ventricosus TaxID=182803 RepID=A0A4Y2PWB5_ARAVE|nr:hypothetical protein AVEN_67335-1 [Araneus ventricosus]